mmetsp:Transcript_40859/g.123125  ORF Transcript_40859/g.123125 Transcript_40859/m.123125 type:complete len:213 (-) Transcript_40859:1383-2021(-)
MSRGETSNLFNQIPSRSASEHRRIGTCAKCRRTRSPPSPPPPPLPPPPFREPPCRSFSCPPTRRRRPEEERCRPSPTLRGHGGAVRRTPPPASSCRASTRRRGSYHQSRSCAGGIRRCTPRRYGRRESPLRPRRRRRRVDRTPSSAPWLGQRNRGPTPGRRRDRSHTPAGRGGGTATGRTARTLPPPGSRLPRIRPDLDPTPPPYFHRGPSP